MKPSRPLALWLALPLALSGCAQSAALRGQIAGLAQIVEQAEKNGALRCAPRELAIAKSQLEFATIELDQGFASKAQAHLAKAEPNARAAELLSPAERCAGQGGDRDGDGYADPVDQCPSKPENYNGYQDEDGCPDDPDSDGDGIADSRDQCELNPEDKDSYLDSDGCPEPDNDLDGLLDAADQCPNDPEDLDGYEDEDGCPDPDNDKDTVPDVTDQCPNEIGGTTQEPLGCPGNRLAVVTDCEVKITQQIHFETN
ncbi:MAG TPA: thrombospondin type 3 repeat-containing protein, partial [Polyangiaceae bacterium]